MLLRGRPWNADYENLARGDAYNAAVGHKLFCIFTHVEVNVLFMMGPGLCK